MTEAEWQSYHAEYLVTSEQREAIMGMLSYSRQEGRQEGEATLLCRQLERKFGPLDEVTRVKLATADAETLLVWGERVLDAANLAEVFAECDSQVG